MMNTRRARKELEDPHNSWNHQLMTATLRFDIAEVESLIIRGADPVNAREPTFFSKGDLLSPLAALLLQGTFTPEAILMAQFLIDRGAGLNDLMALPGQAHFLRAGSSSGRNSSAGPLVSGENTANMRLGSNSGRASIVEGKEPPSSRGGKPLSHSSGRSRTMDNPTVNEGTHLDGLPSPRAVSSGSPAPPTQEMGTVLHYVVALGDVAHLLQILTIAGQRRHTLPQSLMHEVVLGIMIPPKPSPTEERASSRNRKPNSSVSRQPSRSTSKNALQGGGGGNEAAHAPRSCLPVLKSVPAPFSPLLRLEIPHPSVSCSTISEMGSRISSRVPMEAPSVDGSRPNSKEGKLRETIGSVPSGAAAGIHLRSLTTSEGGGEGEGSSLMKSVLSPKKAKRRQNSSLFPATIGAVNASPPSGTPVPSSATKTGTSGKGSTHSSKVQIDVPAASFPTEGVPHPEYLDLCFDFSTKSSTGLPVADFALQRGDIVATRLLTFYGAKINFQELVNGSQTALARACSTGDVPMMERLLDAGDTLTQISTDGRYTLVHYAVAHPAALDYLARRGLSLDFENAFGESALHSLILHGFGRNAENAIRDCPKMQDAAKLAALPLVAVRNYILMPLSSVLGGGGAGGASGGGGKQNKPNSGRGGGKGNTNATRGDLANALPPNPSSVGSGREDPQRRIRLLRLGGGRESDAWWCFSSLSTSDMIQHLCDAGANIHGNVPQEECDLRYSIFAEEMSRHRAATLVAMTNATQLKKRASLPTASLWNEEPFMPYDPNQLWFTESVQLGRKPYRCTPLMCAITAYHPELIRKLVMDYHVDLSRRDSLGASCLHHAAICPHPSALELLFSCGSQEWNAIDMEGRTPLHYAVLMGNMENIKALLRHPAILAGKPDTHGLTPLHLAVLANETAAVGLLLRHSDSMVNTLTSGLSVSNAKPSRRQKTNKIANTSFSAGASMSGLMISSISTNAAPSVAGGYSVAGSVIGGGPLGSGAQSGRPGTGGGAAEFQMVDVEAEDAVEHATPLEFAIKYHRHPSIVQLLLQEGHANMQRWSGLEGGGSLLHRAAVDGREDYVRLLLDHFANPNEPDNEDRTPLYFAVDTEKPNIALIRSLMQAGAFPFAQSGTTLSTPLHIAAKRVHADVLDLLFHERIPGNTAAGNALSSVSGPSFLSTDDGVNSPPRRPLRGGGILDRPGSGGTGGGDVGSDFTSFTENTVLHTEKGGSSDRFGSPSSLSILTSKGENGSTPIQLESKGVSGSVYATAALIPCGYFLSTDSQAQTPLHLLCAHTKPATQQRALPLIEKLVRCNNAVELSGMMDAHGRTPLHYACRATFIEAVRLLLTVDPLLVYHVDASGYTPLHDTVYASICAYPRFFGPPHSGSPATTVSKNSTGEGQENAIRLSGSGEVDHSRALEDGDSNKVEKEEEHSRSGETEEEPPYSEEEHAQRMEDVIVLIADVVQRSIPQPLRGFPLIHSSVRTFSPSLSITQQIMRKHLYENRWANAPTSLTCTDSSGTSSEDVMIHSVPQYLRVSDHHGRTPLLLAGELGNNAAASMLLRIWKVLPMLSSPSPIQN